MQELQDIHRLQAFVAVVQEGSLSAAVHRLHVTQPALSARLKLLEESLGCTLLERTARGMRPTDIGKLVYGIAVEILKRMEHLHATVKNQLELREGYVHLAGSSTAVASLFPEAISVFRKVYPFIQFTLHEKDATAIVEALHDGLIDVGLVTDNPFVRNQDEFLHGLQIHGKILDTLEMISSPDHPLAKISLSLAENGKSLLPLHVTRQPMILPEAGGTARDLIDSEFQKLGIRPKVMMTLRSNQSMITMVEKNIGLGVVSSRTLNKSNSVRTLKVQGLKMERFILICSVRGREISPAARRFIETLKKLAESAPPERST